MSGNTDSADIVGKLYEELHAAGLKCNGMMRAGNSIYLVYVDERTDDEKLSRFSQSFDIAVSCPCSIESLEKLGFTPGSIRRSMTAEKGLGGYSLVQLAPKPEIGAFK